MVEIYDIRVEFEGYVGELVVCVNFDISKKLFEICDWMDDVVK